MEDLKYKDIYKNILDNEIYLEYDTFKNKIKLLIIYNDTVIKDATIKEAIDEIGIVIDEENLNIIENFIRLIKTSCSMAQVSFKGNLNNINKWYLLECFSRNESENIARGSIKSLYGILNNTEKLLEMSKSDPLTGLLNRVSMEDYVNNLIEEKAFFNFVMLDLDHFKSINDTFGHIIGDSVIREVAKILKSVIKDIGEAGRLGGDEFVLVRKLDHAPTIEENRELCRIIRSRVEEARKYNSVMSYVTVTVGLTTSPFDGATYQELYSKADKALYKGKYKGRNCYVIYIDALHKNINTGKKLSDITIENFKNKASISEFIGSLFTSILELKRSPYDKFDEIFNYFNLDRISYKVLENNEFKVVVSKTADPKKEKIEFFKVNNIEAYDDLFEVDQAFILNDVSEFKSRNKHKKSAISVPYDYGSIIEVACGKKSRLDLIISFEVIGDRRIWMKEQLNGMKVVARMLASFYYLEKNNK